MSAEVQTMRTDLEDMVLRRRKKWRAEQIECLERLPLPVRHLHTCVDSGHVILPFHFPCFNFSFFLSLAVVSCRPSSGSRAISPLRHRDCIRPTPAPCPHRQGGPAPHPPPSHARLLPFTQRRFFRLHGAHARLGGSQQGGGGEASLPMRPPAPPRCHRRASPRRRPPLRPSPRARQARRRPAENQPPLLPPPPPPR